MKKFMRVVRNGQQAGYGVRAVRTGGLVVVLGSEEECLSIMWWCVRMSGTSSKNKNL